MPKQPAISNLRDTVKKKATRREKSLAEMDAAMPRSHLFPPIKPHYPKGGVPSMLLETMRCVGMR